MTIVHNQVTVNSELKLQKEKEKKKQEKRALILSFVALSETTKFNDQYTIPKIIMEVHLNCVKEPVIYL